MGGEHQSVWAPTMYGTALLGLVLVALLVAVCVVVRLRLAPNTVSNHISSILAKLQVASRPEAIGRACSAAVG
jgi:hypothetical protein